MTTYRPILLLIQGRDPSITEPWMAGHVEALTALGWGRETAGTGEGRRGSDILGEGGGKEREWHTHTGGGVERD